MQSVANFSPAKINLFLSVTGRRDDGFHDLVSVVVPLDWGDRLEAEAAPEFSLECSDPDLPVDESNLVLRAARRFATVTGWKGGAHFRLEKRIPVGAGLGGGSSNAAAALLALNAIAGQPLDAGALAKVAAEVGSDCPLFLAGGPCVIRGRGERVEPLPAATAARLRRRRLMVFKPGFGVSTPWAYRSLAEAAAEGGEYPGAGGAAEERLAKWLGDPNLPAEAVLANDFEAVVSRKFLAIPVLLAELRERFGVAAGLSGSGSACFLFQPEGDITQIRDCIVDAWGPGAVLAEATVA